MASTFELPKASVRKFLLFLEKGEKLVPGTGDEVGHKDLPPHTLRGDDESFGVSPGVWVQGLSLSFLIMD